MNDKREEDNPLESPIQKCKLQSPQPTEEVPNQSLPKKRKVQTSLAKVDEDESPFQSPSKKSASCLHTPFPQPHPTISSQRRNPSSSRSAASDQCSSMRSNGRAVTLAWNLWPERQIMPSHGSSRPMGIRSEMDRWCPGCIYEWSRDLR